MINNDKNRHIKTITFIFLTLVSFTFLYLLITKEGKNYENKKEEKFPNGVLAVNTNKSFYTINEKVEIGAASLRPDGNTLCNSDLEIKIKQPDNTEVTLSTKDGGVEKSSTCDENNNVTNNPDYFSVFYPAQEGKYTVVLSNKDNENKQETEFEVILDPQLNIERQGVTRINPFATDRYPMILKVTSEKNFSGQVIETIPSSFDIVWNGNSSTEESESEKNIIWDVDLKAGETIELIYEYKAPQISPDFVSIGKAQIIQEDKKVFEEIKKWQIASDGTTIYNYSVCGASCGPSSDWWASGDDVDQFPFGGNAANRNTHTEATSANYSSISASDNSYWTTTNPGSGDQVLTWIEMKIEEAPSRIFNIDLTWEGYISQGFFYTTDVRTWVLTSGANWVNNNSWTQVGGITNMWWSVEYTKTETISSNFNTYIGSNKMLTWAVHSERNSTSQVIDYIETKVSYYEDVTGTVYTNENKTTNIGAGKNVSLYRNGTYVGSTLTNANGVYSFASYNLLDIGNGDVLLVYLDNESEKGSTIVVADGSPIYNTNADIIVNRVSLMNRVPGNDVTIADIDQIDSADPQNEDGVSVSNGALTVANGFELLIPLDETFTPGGNVTTPKLDVKGTYNGGTETLTLNTHGTGSCDSDTSMPLCVGHLAKFTAPTNTIFTASSIGIGIINTDTYIQNVDYKNLTISPNISSDTIYSFTPGPVNIDGNFTINPNSTSSKTLTVLLNGTTKVSTVGTTTISGTGSATSILDTDVNQNNALLTGKLNITAGGTLDARKSDIILTGTSGTIFTRTGVFNAGQSTVTYRQEIDNDTTLTSGNITFYNMIVDIMGTGTLGSPITVQNDLLVANGTLDDGGHQITGNSTGTLTINSDASLALGGATNATTFPTNFTVANMDLDINSTVIYKAGVDQIIPVFPPYGNLSTNPTLSSDVVYHVSGPLNVRNNMSINSYSTSSRTLTVLLRDDINVANTLTVKGTGSANSILDTTDYKVTSKNINIENGGIINARSSDIYVSGDWACTGTLNPYTSKVYLNGTSTQHVSGSTTFYDFIVQTSTPKTVVFMQDATVYIVDGGTIELSGTAGNILTATSNSEAPWYLRLHPNADAILNYLNVSQSNAGGYKTIIATNGTVTDGGMNINWRFVEPSQYIMTNFEKVDLSGVDINN
jgi:hypothetical protein